MHDMILLDPAQMFADLLALLSFVGGWALKGIIGAVASELAFRPLARTLRSKSEQWEESHPILLAWTAHFAQGHAGNRPSQCDTDRCQQLS